MALETPPTCSQQALGDRGKNPSLDYLSSAIITEAYGDSFMGYGRPLRYLRI
jgi:hypothetical protein